MDETHVKRPGLAPGTLVAPPDAVRAEGLEVLHYTADKIEAVEAGTIEDVRQFRQQPGVTWVNVNGLGNVRLLEDLGQFLDLHPLALEDTLHVDQRPKVDDYEDHLYIVLRMLHFEEGLETEQISVFLGDGWVVTVQERPGDPLNPVRDRLRGGVGQLRSRDASYLMYAIVDAIIDHYFPFLEQLGEHIDALEDEVLCNPTRETLGEVQDIKGQLISVRRAIWPVRDAVNTLVRDDSPLVHETTALYLRDCYDHTIRVLDIVETDRELAAGLMDIYLSSLSNKMNEVMKVLTIIATIFIPLTFIAGVYGMNFDPEVSSLNMPELKWRYGYVAVWAVMIALAIVMLLLFRRVGWLGGEDIRPPREEEKR
ncbi:MAG: magnesium/cobalt transporter CorA [Planctomycetota bacterium]